MKYHNKKILIGMTGGIAAYKVCEMVRYFVKQGAEVKVIMTHNATEFVTPLTLETLSKNRVTTDVFPNTNFPEMLATHHVALGQWPDVTVVVPAGSNILAKIAGGIADEVLSTVLSASPKPVVFATAMNDQMYLNEATQKNITNLRMRGYEILPPDEGFLAEGYESVGRLTEFDHVELAVDKIVFGKSDFKGKKILVTAGPTRELLDPVRFLTNFSSGKMGFAIAHEAVLWGADVTLIHGSTTVKPPVGVRRIAVQSSDEMAKAVLAEFVSTDILIMTAAVADFKPASIAENKIKKSDEFQLALMKTKDILQAVSKVKKNQLVVGFALETQDDTKFAKKKLTDKNLDLIVVNNALEEGAGFNTDTNRVTLIDANSEESLPRLSKTVVAQKILEKIHTKYIK